MADQNLQREFSAYLKEKLAADRYGNYERLPPKFLETMCDRIAEISEPFILAQRYKDPAFEVDTQTLFDQNKIIVKTTN